MATKIYETETLLSIYERFGDKSQDAIDFIKRNQLSSIPNCDCKHTSYSICLSYKDGHLEKFVGDNPKNGVVGVTIVDGSGGVFTLSHKNLLGSLVKDTKKCELDHSRYFKREVDALIDIDYLSGTRHLKDCGCTMDIPEGFYIPTLAQLVLIVRHIDEVNKALEYIGHDKIKTNDWYWSCTEAGRSDAWAIRVSSGRMGTRDKRVYTFYIRPITNISQF